MRPLPLPRLPSTRWRLHSGNMHRDKRLAIYSAMKHYTLIRKTFIQKPFIVSPVPLLSGKPAVKPSEAFPNFFFFF